MRIQFNKPCSIGALIGLTGGVKAKYANKGSTLAGTIYCQCNKCVGHVIYNAESEQISGWVDTSCSKCGMIDFSDAKSNI